MGDPKVIRTVGDSHAIHPWHKIPGVVTSSVGPMLMHSFGLSPQHHILAGVPRDGILVFCWGEIDCRCHVNKFQPWQETVDKLAANYLDCIRRITLGFGEVWIFNVVPPPRRARALESNGFPFVGTDEERLGYVRRLNDRLRESEFVFVDVYDSYADEDGFLRMELSDCHVHLSDEKPLADWIKRRFEHETPA